MDVFWSDEARADRDAILAFLLERNPVAALRVAEGLVLATDSLSTFPDRGRPGRVPNTRELVTVRPYVVVYGVRGDQVVILRIWHGAQDRP
jgi:plasmid stabilization system protein ParE